MQRVLTDPALRAALGRAGRETAVRHYGWTSIIGKLTDIYAEIQSTRAATRQPQPA
jgi:glycosyltransferase involved in cell wall biosynthesis